MTRTAVDNARSGVAHLPSQADDEQQVDASKAKARTHAATQQSAKQVDDKQQLIEGANGRVEQQAAQPQPQERTVTLFKTDALAGLASEQVAALPAMEVSCVEPPHQSSGGDAAKSFADLAARYLDPKVVPDPKRIGTAFEPPLDGAEWPALGVMPPKLAALPIAMRRVADGKQVVSSAQWKRVELVRAFSRILEADLTQRPGGEQTARQRFAHIPPAATAQLQRLSKTVASTFSSYMQAGIVEQDDAHEARITDLDNGVPVLPRASVVALETDLLGLRRADTTNACFMDIDALLLTVMFSCARTEESLLRDQMFELDRMNKQKKALREVKTKMKQESARLDAAMRREYSDLSARGVIGKGHTYDEYKAWRQCQWADIQDDGDGATWPSAQLEQPIPPIPQWLTLDTDVADAAATTPPPAAALGDDFGLPPAVMKMLDKIFDHLPPNEKEDYASFDEWLSTAGFIPVRRVPDDVLANLDTAKGLIDDYRETAASNAPSQVNTLADLQNPNSRICKLVNDIAMLRVLTAANPDSGSAAALLQVKEHNLAKVLGRPHEGSDVAYETAFQEMVTAVTQDAIKGFTAIKERLDRFYEHTVEELVSAKQGQNGATVTGGCPDWADDESFFEEVVEAATLGLLGGDNDVGEAFPGGHLGEGSDGQSHANSGVFGPDGYYFSASWEDSSDYGMFEIRVPASKDAWTTHLTELMTQAGEVTLSHEHIAAGISALSTMQEEAWGGDGCFAITGPEAGTVDEDGNALIEESDLDKMEDKIAALEADLDPNTGDPKSAFARWVHSHDYDGSQAAAAEAESVDEEEQQADALQEDSPLGVEGIALDFSGTLEQFEAFITEADNKLQALSEMGELQALNLQIAMERRAKYLETLSNLMKKIDQTAEVIVSNLK